ASPHAPALACVLPPFPTRRSSDLGVLRTCGARPLGPPGHSPVPLPLHGGEVLGTAGWWLGPGVLRTCGARPFGPPGHSPVPLPRSEEHTLNSSHVKISYAVFCL